MLALLLSTLLACTTPVACVGCDTGSREDDTGDTGQASDTSDTTDTDSEDTDDSEPPFVPPERILFIGNSFTFGGPVPTIVDVLANDAGWPDPTVTYSAFGGESLEGHRDRAETLAKVDEGTWDVVVLQELSTRPTDNLGDPVQFKTDATWFVDRILQTSPDARVVLYETWARHPDHPYYPNSFDDPAEMQAQLRVHYNDAADTWIPAHAAVVPPLVVAPAGDAWERHLGEASPLRLHADDDYHANSAGQYLNGLVIYSTIYGRSAAGLTPWNLSPTAAGRLQQSADATTGMDRPGPGSGLPSLQQGESVRLDLGSDATPTTATGWNNLTDATNGYLRNALTSTGTTCDVDITVTDAFGGVNTNGTQTSLFPGNATTDSFFCGSFDDHAAALQNPAALTFSGLDPDGHYTLQLFAARTGNDGGAGRLTRYSAGGAWVDLDASDNTTQLVELPGLAPSALGTLTLDVAVSPAGNARFCYLGVVVLERD